MVSFNPVNLIQNTPVLAKNNFETILLLFILPLILRAVLDYTSVSETIIVIRGFIAAFIFLVRRTEPSHLVPLVPAVDTPVRTAFHTSHATVVDA